jgi:hypothetical protein
MLQYSYVHGTYGALCGKEWTQRIRSEDVRVPSMMQALQGSEGELRSHLHLDLRHWSHAKINLVNDVYYIESD